MAHKLAKCRLCLKLGTKFVSIFANDDMNMQFAEMVMEFAKIKIQADDELPDKICAKCILSLNNAYLFKQQCERVDRELRRNSARNIDLSPLPSSQNVQIENVITRQEPITSTVRDSITDSLPDITIVPIDYSTPTLKPNQSKCIQVKNSKNPSHDLTIGMKSVQTDIQPSIHSKNGKETNSVKVIPNNTPVTTCHACHKQFKLNIEYKRHLNICPKLRRSGNTREAPSQQIRKFRCHICNNLLKTKVTLRKHMINMHSIEKTLMKNYNTVSFTLKR